MKDTLKTFKIVGKLEGISFLLLLGIAMPLKYAGGIDEAVQYTGWAHGVLFMLYMVLLLMVKLEHKWSIGKAALGVIAAFLPFGPFILDKRLS